MAIYNVRRSGYGTGAEAVIGMIGDLITGGMRLVYPNNAFGPIVPTVADNLHPSTGFMMTTTRINFDGDPYMPVARFILESTNKMDVKAVINAVATTVTFSGTITPNIDGFTSTLSVTTPPASGAIAVGMTVTLATVTTTTAAPSVTTTTAGPVIQAFTSGVVLSGSGTTWTISGYRRSGTAVAFKATDNYTSLTDPSLLTAGWRICFDFPLQYLEDYISTTIDPTTRARTPGQTIGGTLYPALTDKVVGSTIFDDFVAVYLGTSVQLRNDGQISILPDISTVGNAVKVKYLQPDGLVGASYRIAKYNPVGTKTVALVPPITIMKAYVSFPRTNTPALVTIGRLGSNITDNMKITGQETLQSGANAGNTYKLLPFTFFDGDPADNASQTNSYYPGTGFSDEGTYKISVTSGYTTYKSAAPAGVYPDSTNPIKVIGVATEITGADVGFINRINLDRLSGLAIPLTYEITVTQKGIFIGVWDVLSEQNGKRFNWIAAQRSVDRLSGAIRGRTKTTETGKVGTFLTTTASSVAPVYCINCVNDLYYQFIVREQDTGGPSIPASAAVNSEDNTAIINPFDQQSITDDGKYVITFLNKLSTNRYRYPDELDMVGTISADVIGFGTEVRISAYDEEKDVANPLQRVYRSLPSNSPFGTGMRLMVLNTWEDISNGVGVPGVPNIIGPISETPLLPTSTTTTTPAPTTTTPAPTTTTPAPTTTTPAPTTTTPAPVISDRRLKHNINLLETRNGINIYSFQYLWSDVYFVGVMAQDLLDTQHASAVVEKDGYYTVDYSQLGFDMQTLSEYHAAMEQEQL